MKTALHPMTHEHQPAGSVGSRMRECVRRPKTWLGSLLLLAGFAAAIGVARAQGAPPAQEAAQGKYEFEMRDKPWDQVLEWLTDIAGVPVVGGHKPSGTFNFIGTAKKKQYTLAEIIDLLNEQLLAQKSILIRRPNSIIIVPSDKPEEIDPGLVPRITLDELEADKPAGEQKYGRTELAQVVFSLQSLTPDDAEKDIQTVLGPFKKVQKLARNNKLLVTDTVGNLRRAKKMLDESDGAAGDFTTISLGALDAEVVIKLLQANKSANVPLLEKDVSRNAIIVRGTPQQVNDVKKAIRSLGGEGGSITGGADSPFERVRIIPVGGRNASAVTEALLTLWPNLRANPIESATQSQLLGRLDAWKKAGKPVLPNLKGQLSDPREAPAGRSGLPGDKSKAVIVAPLLKPATSDSEASIAKNSIMVGTDDPEAMVIIEEMTRILCEPGDGNFVVIPLKHANADEVAKKLDELFNNVKPQSGRGGMNPMMMMMGGGMGGDTRRESDSSKPSYWGRPIRVVSDARTNSLLVKAAPLELVKIRNLLDTLLDTDDTDSSAIATIHIIGPLKNSNASDVADKISEIFKDFMNKSGGGSGQFNPFFPGGRMPQEPTVKTVTLSVDANEQTNQLIVRCQEPLFKEIEKLVNELDKTAQNSNRVVKIYRPKSMDPEVLQKAGQAISGEDPKKKNAVDPAEARRNAFRSMLFGGGMGGQSQGGGGRGSRGSGGSRGGGGSRPDAGGPETRRPGGPDFFADEVKDDRRVIQPVLFDPQRHDIDEQGRIVAQQPKPQQPQQPAADLPPAARQLMQAGEPNAPRRPVTIEASPEGGFLVITGDEKDVEAMYALFEELERRNLPAEIEIRVFPVKNGDATSVASTLEQVYKRIIVKVGANTRAEQNQQDSSIVIIPLSRQNAILIGAPKGRMDDIEKNIALIDRKIGNDVTFKTYALKKAKAATVAQTIRDFYSARFPTESLSGQNQVKIQADENTNTILVQASPTDQEEIEKLIKYLESNLVPAEIKVFSLKRADAAALKTILQELFIAAQQGGGQGGGSGQQQGANVLQTLFQGGQTGISGGGQGGQGGGQSRGQQPGGAQTPGQIDLAMSVDIRTNSLIIAGTRSDLQLVEAIVFRLDSTDVREKINRVVRLRNIMADDAYAAINGFLQAKNNLAVSIGELTGSQQLEREIIVVPEKVNNALIVSATPRYFEDVMQLISDLDTDQPQVVIQVLIGEVRMENTEEFGVELGVQSPVLFRRGITPANGFFGTGTVSYASAAGGLVPPGVTVNNSINPAALPGFNFNNTGALGNNPVVSPGVFAPQGITNLGVGRASASGGPGGFVFSAGSDAFNLLIRALKTQGKIDVLSRPQIMTLDNQPASIQVGQDVPIVTGSTTNAINGGFTNSIQYRSVGIILEVTPKISPDGYVLMNVSPEVSSLSNSTVDVGNNFFAPIINTTQASTTISAMDGQTVIIGGLITRRDEKLERKIPWLGDLPYLGTAFRYRTQNKVRTELIIALTPRVVRNRLDAERIKAQEAAKMNWVLGDAEKVHGSLGLDYLHEKEESTECETHSVVEPAMPVEIKPGASRVAPARSTNTAKELPVPSRSQEMSPPPAAQAESSSRFSSKRKHASYTTPPVLKKDDSEDTPVVATPTRVHYPEPRFPAPPAIEAEEETPPTGPILRNEAPPEPEIVPAAPPANPVSGKTPSLSYQEEEVRSLPVAAKAERRRESVPRLIFTPPAANPEPVFQTQAVVEVEQIEEPPARIVTNARIVAPAVVEEPAAAPARPATSAPADEMPATFDRRNPPPARIVTNARIVAPAVVEEPAADAVASPPVAAPKKPAAAPAVRPPAPADEMPATFDRRNPPTTFKQRPERTKEAKSAKETEQWTWPFEK